MDVKKEKRNKKKKVFPSFSQLLPSLPFILQIDMAAVDSEDSNEAKLANRSPIPYHSLQNYLLKEIWLYMKESEYNIDGV